MTRDNAMGGNTGPSRRIFKFGGLPVLASASPLLALPILARTVTVNEWAAIAIGQSVGGIAALMISNGWNISGPVTAAQTRNRGQLLSESMFARLLMSCMVVPLAAAIVLLIPAHGQRTLVAAVTVSTALGGLGLAWLAIGTGRPGLLAAAEVGPRVVANISGAMAAFITHTAIVYPVITGMVQIVAIAVFWRREAGQSWLLWRGARPLATIRGNLSATGTEVVAGVYSIGASAIVAVSGTAVAVSTFNVGYRLVSFGAIGIAALSNGLTAWVAEASGETFVIRAKQSLRLHLALGILGFIGLSVLGPAASSLLFSPALSVSRPLTIAMGVFFLLWSVETVVSRHILASRGKTRAMLASTLAGSTVGVAALLLASTHGAVAAGWALVAALGLIVALQSLVAIRVMRHELNPN